MKLISYRNDNQFVEENEEVTFMNDPSDDPYEGTNKILSVYRTHQIIAIKSDKSFIFRELCDEYFTVEMDMEAFQKYINDCQELLNSVKE